jgi:hypothetical protein
MQVLRKQIIFDTLDAILANLSVYFYLKPCAYYLNNSSS